MKPLIGWMLLGALCLGGCTDQERKALEAKCDAPLRARVAAAQDAGQDEVLDVLGKADGPIGADRTHQLAEAGAELGNVSGDLFTARVHASAVGRVAAVEFVVSLQLAQVREPLKP